MLPYRPRILVPRLMDAGNLNAQNANARALLARFGGSCTWVAPHHEAPAGDIARAAAVELVPLRPARFWAWRMIALYQRPFDAVVYPGVEWFDDLALRFRSATGRHVPVVATLEALAGDESREAELSAWAGHPVHCQRVGPSVLERIDGILRAADHVIAVSPFLGRAGRHLYGDKISVCSLGVDAAIYHARGREPQPRFTAVGAGGVAPRKRPELFLDLARRSPRADFRWFGEGPLRAGLERRAAAERLPNVSFPGPLPPSGLARELRRAQLLVVPSLSEGAPKVVEEAAACGVPALLFGFYEAPSVRDGETGCVVWSDEELFARAGELIEDPSSCAAMGRRAAEMAEARAWDLVAPVWEARLLEVLGFGELAPAGRPRPARRPRAHHPGVVHG